MAAGDIGAPLIRTDSIAIERNFNLRVTFTRNLDKMRHDIPNIQ